MPDSTIKEQLHQSLNVSALALMMESETDTDLEDDLDLRCTRFGHQHHPAAVLCGLNFASSYRCPTSSFPTNYQHSAVDANLSSQWMFLSGLYPISLSRFNLILRAGLVGPKPKNLEARIREILSQLQYTSSSQLHIEHIEPRFKDGGAFIKFTSSTQILPDLLRSDLLTKFKEQNIKPFWWIGANPDIHLVQGKPWFEDMNMYPNKNLLVEFQGPALSQEELWTLIRPFGRVKEINLLTPKDAAQIARVTLDSARSAAIARSCLHGLAHRATRSDPSTKLRILYSSPAHARTARNWLSSHLRIVLPVLAILLGGISYTLFDPIRQFFIQSNIAGTFHIKQNPIFSWLQKETIGLLGFDRDSGIEIDSCSSAVEKERREAIRELSSWISGNPESFIVILGPKGSGKTQVLQSVLHKRRNSLVIDCAKLIQDATTENILIADLAKSLGYFPQFSFLSSVNNAIDLATASLIGQKAGFSSTPQDQIAQILETAEKAIQTLAKNASASRQLHSKQSSHAESVESEKGGLALLFQQISKNIPVSRNLAQCPDVPVVVLKDLSIQDSTKHRALWECLADWANRLTEKGIAHVIFTTENSAALKRLPQVFSQRLVRSIALTDASADNATQYVFRRLSRGANRNPVVSQQESSLIQVVGGRLTDLDALVKKVESGLKLECAVEEIVAESIAEIKRNCFVGDHESGAAKQFAWTNHQVWDLIKRMSQQEEIPMYPILSEIFGDNFSILSALEATDLITLSPQEDGEIFIKIGKPVYRTAIHRLLGQNYFAASNDLNLAKNKLTKAEELIQIKLNELIEIGKLFPTIHTVGSDRGNWLFGTSFSNEKIPNPIKWKVLRILDDLKKYEKIVDLMEHRIEQAQSVLKAQCKS